MGMIYYGLFGITLDISLPRKYSWGICHRSDKRVMCLEEEECRLVITQSRKKKSPETIHSSTTIKYKLLSLNTLRSRQNGRHFVDDIFRCIFLNENILILIKISLKFVPKDPVNNIPAWVQIMAWRRPGGKPLFEPMMIILLTHISITRPQWVNPCTQNKCSEIQWAQAESVELAYRPNLDSW